jgi:membrane associated rhomboid family serine protease
LSPRRQALVVVQLAFAAVSTLAAIALTFSLGPVSHATNQTTAHIVGAALLALAVGAVAAARDPEANRTMLRVEIVFMALSALDLVRKLVADEGGQARTWALLAGLIAGAVVLVWLYPAARERQGSEVSQR